MEIPSSVAADNGNTYIPKSVITAGARENPQSESVNKFMAYKGIRYEIHIPKNPGSCRRENPQSESASVGAVGAVGAVVGVATRESRLCRQTHLTDSDRFNEILENLQILK